MTERTATRESVAETTEVLSLRILASAIAGRAVEVALADPGRRTWSDGSTIFLEDAADRAEQVRLRDVEAGVGEERLADPRTAQGDIDIAAVVEARVDLVAGSPHEDDLHIENRRQRRDLSVLVLLDVSGSASEPATGGRTVHEQQVDAAGTIVRALNELGDRVALYHAFNPRGRSAVHVTAVKRFELIASYLDERISED